MAENLIHGQEQSGYAPKYFPYKGDVAPAEIDRAQSFAPTFTINDEEIEELGNPDIVENIDGIDVIGGRLVQKEYGSIEFFQKLANVSSGDVELNDFYTSAGDIGIYLTDVEGTFAGTLWLPKQRLAGFSVGAGDPLSSLDRNFEFVGDKGYTFQGNNKYLIYRKFTVGSGEVGSGGSYETSAMNDPIPVEDPNNSGVYLLRVLRVRSGTTTELELTTDYTYDDSTYKMTVLNAQTDDVYKVMYSAGSYITGESPFSVNTTDKGAIKAHSVDLYIGTSNKLLRVQSATIDVRLTRGDVYEWGSDEAVLRSVDDKTVTVTLGELLNSEFRLQEVLRKKSTGHGILRNEDLAKDLIFIMAIYETSAKTTFKMGYKITDLKVSDENPGAGNLKANSDSGVTLTSKNLLITETEGSGGLGL